MAILHRFDIETFMRDADGFGVKQARFRRDRLRKLAGSSGSTKVVSNPSRRS